jgi:hypothetical protein
MMVQTASAGTSPGFRVLMGCTETYHWVSLHVKEGLQSRKRLTILAWIGTNTPSGNYINKASAV